MRTRFQMRWPWPTVADMTSTLKPGLHFVASSSGFGKTTFMSCALRGAVADGHQVLVFATEMPVDDLKERYVCEELGLDYDLVASRDWDHLPEGTEAKVEAGLARFAEAPLSGVRFWPDQMVTPARVFAGIRRAAELGTKVVILDHMAAIGYEGGFSPQALIAFCGELQDLVTKLDMVCLCVSQLNRGGAMELLRLETPMKEWLYGGAALENYASSVLVLGPSPRLDLDEKALTELRKAVKDGKAPASELHMPGVTVVYCIKHRTLGRRGDRGDGAQRLLKFWRHSLYEPAQVRAILERERLASLPPDPWEQGVLG